MGCCVSSNKASTTSLSQTKDHDSALVVENGSEIIAPPPHAEEETVKEVLSSETPRRNSITTKPESPKPHEKETLHVSNKAEEEGEEENVSQVSNETMSTITDEGEKTSKRVIRSQATMHKNRSFSGDLGGKRGRMVQVGHKMRNQPNRRDAGDNSFRRTRSPATGSGNGAAKSVMGRSQSARRINRPLARVGTSVPENRCRKKENPKVKGELPYANESLENPLVSLECFIFI